MDFGDLSAEAIAQAAAFAGQDPVTRAALQQDPSVHKPHKYKLQAAKASHKAVVKGLDAVIGGDRKMEQKLRDECSAGNYDQVMELVGNGVNVNAADEKRRTPLHFAAVQGDASIVKYLLDNGASPHQRDMNGNTPLHLAACTSKIPVITQLLQGGCDVRATDGMGRTALDYAAGHLRIIKRYRATSSPEQYSAKALEVVHLLQECLKQLGDDARMQDVSALEDQFKGVTTVDEMESLESMLEGLVGLTITAHQGGGES
eukprot:TRINITY_DN8152_c0_g1_i2.p1 TRINITY_DN8152_c0_g1~~TRINITY_DN8152_c0_g1_i2.p1  ORF type:complete len:259 (+),score=70.27 TRINITY_DN8152_c0_g1_i2:454-1230(+)